MTNHFALRKVQKSDNAELAALIRGVFHELDAPKVGTAYNDPTTDDLFGKFKTKNSVLWLAVSNNKILGCCGIYPTEGLPQGCVELVRFFVNANARKQGLGTALFTLCLQSAAHLGYQQIYLESIPIFNNALKMYEQHNFKYLNGPLGNTGHTSCDVWMIKNL